MNLTPEEIEEQCAVLRQYASVLQDFFRALIDASVPADVAGSLTVAWWERALQKEDELEGE